MPAKDNPNTLTYPQLTAFKHHQVEGKTIPETAEIVGVTEKTIDLWKKKAAWRDLAIAALEKQGHTLNDWAKKVVQMKDRKKTKNIGGRGIEVEDNVAQIRYLDSVEKVFGLAAPQKHELIAGPSNAELDKDLEDAANEILSRPVDSVERKASGADGGDSSQGEAAILPV